MIPSSQLNHPLLEEGKDDKKEETSRSEYAIIDIVMMESFKNSQREVDD